MELEAGSELGPYSIVGPIGAGGMGQVYRAKDTRLDREVAIKVLPPQVAADASALARFEREARSVAALSHPNIVAIHDIGVENDRRYVVIELIEGDTLRERLDGDGFDVRKAIEVGSQIARGLGAAHAKNIVHRDLKPENVMITPEGQAKILDFGLSVWDDGGGGDRGPADSTPTRTSLTNPGTVMGTVGYMSPEQVRGEPADARSDIFSFGTVLYEMLTGTRAFQCETAAETMTAILREAPPEPSESGVSLPPATQAIVRRCLEKRPEERFRSAEDLAFALESTATGSFDALSGGATALADTAPASRSGMNRVALGVAGLVLLAAGWAAGRVMTGAPTAASATRGELVRLTYQSGIEASPAIASHGRSLAFVANVDGDPHIFIRRVGGETSIPLTAGVQPAFSPDGDRIAYAGIPGGGIFVMGATGESPRRLTATGFNPAWSPDGTEIVASCESIQYPTGRSQRCNLTRIDVASGEATEIPVDTGDAVQPHWSPGGQRIAFWGLPSGTGKRALYTMPAEGGPALQLTDDDAYNWNPVWSPDGRWLYFNSDRSGRMNIWRMPIDEITGEPRGEAEPVTISTDEIRRFSIAADGSLVFAAASDQYHLERRPFDRERFEATGEPLPVLEGSRPIGRGAVAPDGSKIAFVSNDPLEDLFVVTVESGEVRRLTQDRFKDRGARWIGSEEIVFFSDRSGRYETWKIGADGGALVQLTQTASGRAYTPLPSPDGKWLVVHTDNGAERIDIDGELPASKYTPLPPTPGGSPFFATSWSPDGKKIAGVGIDRSGVVVYDIESESYEAISATGGFPNWLDDESILFGDDAGLHVYNVQSGTDRIVEPFIEDARSIGLAAGYLYTSRADSQSDIWMLRTGG